MALWTGFPILLLIIASLVMTGRTGCRWASHGKTRDAVHGIILALSQLIVVSQLLGLAGCLTPVSLLLAHAVVTIVLRRVLRTDPTVSPGEPAPDPLRRDSPHISYGYIDHLPVFLPLVAGAAALIAAMPHAPGGTDVWTYHLAFPAEWAIWHDLRCSVQHIGDPGPPFYPHHGGLIAHLLMAPLRSDILARFHQVPMWIAGLFALASGITALGIPRRAAWTATALAGLMPLVAAWVPLAFVDISLAGAVSLVFYSAVRIERKSSARQFLIFGLATGLAAGFKAYGLYYSLPIVLWGLVRGPKRRLGAFFAGAVLTGGFWPLRNWILNGNPLFPYQVEWNGVLLFPGLYNRTTMLQHGFHRFNFMQQFTLPELCKTIGIPGFVLIAGVPILLLLLTGTRKFRFISILPLIMGAQFLFLPYRHHPRLLLPALWMCAPALALLLDTALKNRPNVWKIAITIALPVVAMMLTDYAVVHPAVIIAVTVVLSVLSGRMPAVASRTRRWIAGAVLGGLFMAFPWLLSEYETRKWTDHGSELGEIAGWLVELNRERPHLQVAFAGFNTPYPLQGFFLGNTVRFLSRDGDPDASWTADRLFQPMDRLFQPMDRPFRPMDRPAAEPDFEKWRRLVEALRIDVIVIATIPGDAFPPEYHWVREMPDFELGYLTARYQAWTRKAGSDSFHDDKIGPQATKP